MIQQMLPLLLVSLIAVVSAFYSGEFQSEVWQIDSHKLTHDTKIKFIVALSLRNVADMHSTLMDVSNPKSAVYGKFLSREELNANYGHSAANKQKVVDFFRSMPGAEVKADPLSALFEVTASVNSIQSSLHTELSWVKHSRKLTDKKSVRAVRPIVVPEELHDLISFVSLNAPVNHAMPRAAKALAKRRKEARGDAIVRDESIGVALDAAAAGSVGVSPGNEEVLTFFRPKCGIDAVTPNEQNPPCSTSSAANTPYFVFDITAHANSQSDPYLLSDEPKTVYVPTTAVFCYNTYTTVACSGNDGKNCTCIAKVCMHICLCYCCCCTVLN